MQRFALASVALALGSLGACTSGVCNSNDCQGDFGGYDLSQGGQDFSFQQPDLGFIDDLAFPQPDFGNGPDFGHHHHHDFGFTSDFGFPSFDFGQPGVDLSQRVDLAQPPVQDLATAPDLGGTVLACETCLNASCSSDVSACEADPNCVTTLSCVVGSGCFTFAGGSSSFGSCVDSCVLAQSLTLPQTVAVLGEIGALSACAGSCVDTCGGH
jgi:hypothetical protein